MRSGRGVQLLLRARSSLMSQRHQGASCTPRVLRACRRRLAPRTAPCHAAQEWQQALRAAAPAADARHGTAPQQSAAGALGRAREHTWALSQRTAQANSVPLRMTASVDSASTSDSATPPYSAAGRSGSRLPSSPARRASPCLARWRAAAARLRGAPCLGEPGALVRGSLGAPCCVSRCRPC